MSLSDYEKRVLGEIEQSLMDEDPHLAASLDTAPAKGDPRATTTVYTLGLLVALGTVLIGAFAGGGLGYLAAIAGFLVILSCW